MPFLTYTIGLKTIQARVLVDFRSIPIGRWLELLLPSDLDSLPYSRGGGMITPFAVLLFYFVSVCLFLVICFDCSLFHVFRIVFLFFLFFCFGLFCFFFCFCFCFCYCFIFIFNLIIYLFIYLFS